MNTTTTTTTTTTGRDINAYQEWTTYRLTPAYMRGIPTSVWQSALRTRRLHPPAR